MTIPSQESLAGQEGTQAAVMSSSLQVAASGAACPEDEAVRAMTSKDTSP